jgi:hypothetical protein
MHKKPLSYVSKIALSELHSVGESGSPPVGRITLIHLRVLSTARLLAKPSSSRLGLSGLLVAIGLSGFCGQMAFPGPADGAQLTAKPRTAAHGTAAPAATPVPDPAPAPLPDPKPRAVPPPPAPPPPPPSPPPPAAPEPAAPQAVAPSPPPVTFARAARPAAPRVHRTPRRVAVAKTAKQAPRVHVQKSTNRSSRPARVASNALAASPSQRIGSPDSSRNPATVVLMPLMGIALLLLGAAAISPAAVPWPRVATGLHVHRMDLAVLAFGVAGVAVVLFLVQLVGL